jgi:excisionase family DNA binding protein
MENIFYTTQEIAELLGVSPSSIQRWADSGKLQCTHSEGGHRKFSMEHLTEFAMTYNISMKFLDTMKRNSKVREEVVYSKISAAR